MRQEVSGNVQTHLFAHAGLYNLYLWGLHGYRGSFQLLAGLFSVSLHDNEIEK